MHLFSEHFCLMGYRLNKKSSNRQPEANDLHLFESLVRLKVHEINWFSFKEEDKKTGKSE